MNTDLGGYAHSVHKCTTVGGSLSESESNEQQIERINVSNRATCRKSSQ